MLALKILPTGETERVFVPDHSDDSDDESGPEEPFLQQDDQDEIKEANHICSGFGKKSLSFIAYWPTDLGKRHRPDNPFAAPALRTLDPELDTPDNQIQGIVLVRGGGDKALTDEAASRLEDECARLRRRKRPLEEESDATAAKRPRLDLDHTCHNCQRVLGGWISPHGTKSGVWATEIYPRDGTPSVTVCGPCLGKY